MSRRQPDSLFLAEVVPPRGLEASMSAARSMLAASAGERLVTRDHVECRRPALVHPLRLGGGLERALAQLHTAYPQARVERFIPERMDLDPARALTGERAVALELLPAGEPVLPLRTDWRNERDPLAGVLSGRRPTRR